MLRSESEPGGLRRIVAGMSLDGAFRDFELIDSIANGSSAPPKEIRKGFSGDRTVDIAVHLNARIFTGTAAASLIELSDRLSKIEWKSRL